MPFLVVCIDARYIYRCILTEGVEVPQPEIPAVEVEASHHGLPELPPWKDTSQWMVTESSLTQMKQ
jgi:hypothetical protein